MARFTDKVVIVTGGARGIGATTAERIIDEGGRVLIADTNEELGRDLAGRLGGNARFVKVDVTNPADCKLAVDIAVRDLGRLYGLVNSAIRMAPGPMKDLSLADWKTVIDVGLTGTFLMSQAVGRWLIDNDRKGSIVNLSSNGGLTPYSMSGAYSTTKAAVIMLAEHMGLEWAPKGVRVNAVCPAHTYTPLTAYLQDPEIRRGREQVTPLRRVAEPVDIANAILFLLSDEASYITSTALKVDGGLTVSIMNHLPGRKWE